MIGRDGPVRPFDLIRWAREAAVVHQLTTLEAHVLLLLATYANEEAIAWPSIATLAQRSGLKVSRAGTNSSVSAALRGLEERQLVWSKQGGRQGPARRELLFNPAHHAPAQPSGRQEGQAPAPDAQPHCTQEGQPSGRPDAKDQGNGHPQLPSEQARSGLPARRKASTTTSRRATSLAAPQPMGAAIARTVEALRHTRGA